MAAVKGTFVFQRKSPKDSWEDVDAKPLSSLHKDERYQLSLDSAETLAFHNHLLELYRLYRTDGIPIGEAAYVRASGAISALSDLSEFDLNAFLDANEHLGSELTTRMLLWTSGIHNAARIVAVLEGLTPENLGNLDAAVSIRAIAEALSLWNSHGTNGSEEFWQKQFSQRSFLLEQLFTGPCTIIAEKAYVGGKTILNTGGNLADFLLGNDLTSSAAILEIKTPTSPLTGSDYRTGIPNIASGLAGAVVQVLTYKASLIESYLNLRSQSETWEIHDPPCVIIIGNTQSLKTKEQRRTFELFRRQLIGIEVVTFDEIFGRLEKLGAVLAAR